MLRRWKGSAIVLPFIPAGAQASGMQHLLADSVCNKRRVEVYTHWNHCSCTEGIPQPHVLCTDA